MGGSSGGGNGEGKGTTLSGGEQNSADDRHLRSLHSVAVTHRWPYNLDSVSDAVLSQMLFESMMYMLSMICVPWYLTEHPEKVRVV